MNSGPTLKEVPNTYLRQFFRFLGSRDSLLDGTSETLTTLAQLDGSNSFQDYCQFFRNARDQFDQPDIGLMLGRVNQLANMHGPVSTVVFQSTTISDCLDLLKRFTPLRLTVLRTNLVEDEDHIGIQVAFSENTGDVHVPVTETLLLSLAGVISAVSQGQVRPARIELDYPRPTYSYRYEDAFRVPSFHFSSENLRILVSRADADYRTGTDTDPGIRAATIRRCEELLRGVMGAESTSDRIRQIFSDNPGHLWTLKDIAQHLNMSDRTLQRRLTEEGTRYQLLHNEWLMGEAQQLLQAKNLSIESIAMLLGYSDVSNFRQACKRWYGIPPNEFRQRLN